MGWMSSSIRRSSRREPPVWRLVLSLAMLWTLTAGAAELSVEFTYSPADVTLTPAGAYTAVQLTGGARVVDEAGAPAIPAVFANILLPAGAENISCTVAGEWLPLANDITPTPAQPRRPKSRPKTAFVPPNDRYAAATPWPADLATLQGVHDMQGHRFISVRLNPLAYVGATRTLFLREKITVTVRYDLAPARRVAPRQAALFGPLVQSLVVNPDALNTAAPPATMAAPKATLDYLIITAPALSNAFQQLANYRATAAGGAYSTRVMTTNQIAASFPGADLPAKIRACISNSVANSGTIMVLLGGDDTIVPVRYCYATAEGDTETNMPTDLYYSGLGGNWNANGNSIFGEVTDQVDMAWDVVVGRLPMRTVAHVSNYVARLIAYEAGAPPTNRLLLGGTKAWYTYSGTQRPSDNVTGDGHPGFRSTSPPHTYVSDSEAWLRRLFRDGIRSNWPAQPSLLCDTITSWDKSSCGDHPQNRTNTIAAFNRNWTHLMFSGHGSPQNWGLEDSSFGHVQADSLTGMAAVVYTDACLTGHFDKNSNKIDGTTYTTEPCLGEAFLRNAALRGGALAYIGCARYGWGDQDPPPADNYARGGPSTEYAYRFYQRLYETNRTLGVAFAMHKADMISLSGINGCERWIQFGLNLLGDPALRMPGTPSDLAAPVFAANPGPLAATAGVTVAFTVAAGGKPAPVLTLLNTTALTGTYTFSPTSGQLVYTPRATDLGERTFTFRATNLLGSATQVVSVTVQATPPAAPAALWASATNTTDFTAAWSVVSNANIYRLDVGTNITFTGAGSTPYFVPGYSNRNLTSTSFSVTGLTAGATYFFRVRAVNSGGTSPNSATASVTTLAIIPTPPPARISAPVAIGNGLTITIPAVVGVAYQLQYATNLAPATWFPADTATATNNTLPLRDTTPTNRQRYYRVIRP